MNSLIVQTYYFDAQLKSNKPDEKNFSACCKHCIGKKVVCGNINSSSNFIDHVSKQYSKHPFEQLCTK
jgi:hypothetical protein